MSVCAKFQLSSSSRSARKVSVGGGWWVGYAQSFSCQTQPLCCVVLGLGFDKMFIFHIEKFRGWISSNLQNVSILRSLAILESFPLFVVSRVSFKESMKMP